MTLLKIYLGGAAIFALLFGIAVQRIPAPAEPIRVQPPRFDDAWYDRMSMIPERSRKEDRLQLVSMDSKPVEVERILAVPDAPKVVTPVVATLTPDKPVLRHRRSLRMQAGDVCTRHRMKRVLTHGGRSWRCRK